MPLMNGGQINPMEVLVFTIDLGNPKQEKLPL